MNRRRGFLLVMSLMLCALLFVLVLGLLSPRSPLQDASNRLGWNEQARALANAGFEDCRIKLAKDLLFPPALSPDDPIFSYAETLSDSGQVIGTFSVEVDQSLNQAPYFVCRIRSTGLVGPRDQPWARKALVVDLDTAPYLRSDPSQPNPLPFAVLNQQEEP